MINFILSFFLFIADANADAVCNDGTRSYSHGRGTCSHHGGVLSWIPENSTYDKQITYESYKPNPVSSWSTSFSRTYEGYDVYSASTSTNKTIFNYSCYVFEDKKIGEYIYFTIPLNISDSLELSTTKSSELKVYASSSYKNLVLISGNWEWKSEDSSLIFGKSNYFVESIADKLTKADMSAIFNAEHFIVSIRGFDDTIVPVPGIKDKIIEIYKKCSM